MFLCDYHTHSYYSFDGDNTSSPEALCLAAIDKCITHLAITDHFEANAVAESCSVPYKANEAYAELMSTKEKFKDKLNLAIGIELGQGHQYPQETEALFASRKYDFVIGSLHNLRACPDFCFIKMEDLSDAYIGYLFERYLDELDEMVRTVPHIDTVGHITYMQRYTAMCGRNFDFVTAFRERLEAFFSEIISRNIALEVNVSTLWRGLGFAMPDRDILTLYRKCGGKLITLGTDSHHPTNVGRCITDGFELIKSIGFDRVMAVNTDGEKQLYKI